jgi:hypothetical protein
MHSVGVDSVGSVLTCAASIFRTEANGVSLLAYFPDRLPAHMPSLVALNLLSSTLKMVTACTSATAPTLT